MSETQNDTTPAKATVPVVDSFPAPASSGVNWQLITKYALGVLLGGSVLALVFTKDLPVQTYLSMIVTPGLAILAYHSGTKNPS